MRPGVADAWVKVILTDTVRPPSPMERLRERWPHTLVLDFAPGDEARGPAADLRRLARTADPAEICGMFVEFTSGGPADAEQRAVLADVIEAATIFATAAANTPVPVVVCPPICTFNNSVTATETDVADGLVITTEGRGIS